jgi:molybdopterin-guanine dinucleotide biosynthesis protein A
MSLDLSQVTLAVLAGGEGSRMGVPKGQLCIAGRPILVHLLERLEWPAPTLLVTSPGREHPPGCERFGCEVTDPRAGLGPLRGLLTALENAVTPLLVVSTMDMPLITRAQLEKLAAQLAEDPESMGVMVERVADGATQIEPFPSAFRLVARELVASELSAGRRSVFALSRDKRVGLIRPPVDWPEDVWTNLNTQEDAARAGAVIRVPRVASGG